MNRTIKWLAVFLLAPLMMLTGYFAIYYIVEPPYGPPPKRENTRLTLHTLEFALDAHMIRYGYYPSTKDGLQLLVDRGIMKYLPRDGWGRQIVYESTEPGSFTLTSLGADGEEGGQRWNKDLIVRTVNKASECE